MRCTPMQKMCRVATTSGNSSSLADPAGHAIHRRWRPRRRAPRVHAVFAAGAGGLVHSRFLQRHVPAVIAQRHGQRGGASSPPSRMRDVGIGARRAANLTEPRQQHGRSNVRPAGITSHRRRWDRAGPRWRDHLRSAVTSGRRPASTFRGPEAFPRTAPRCRGGAAPGARDQRVHRRHCNPPRATRPRSVRPVPPAAATAPPQQHQPARRGPASINPRACLISSARARLRRLVHSPQRFAEHRLVPRPRRSSSPYDDLSRRTSGESPHQRRFPQCGRAVPRYAKVAIA